MEQLTWLLRKRVLLFGGLLLAAVASTITFVFRGLIWPDPPPALALGLEKKGWAETATALTHRLMGEFPLGSSEERLAQELLLEGFRKVDPKEMLPFADSIGEYANRWIVSKMQVFAS